MAEAKMEQALRALLIDKNGVHESTVEYLEKSRCLTLANFANWVDDKKEIKDIHAKCPKKDDTSDLVALKQAWREVDATISRGVKRASEGLDNEALDDPLQVEIFKGINKTFLIYYNWLTPIDSRRIGCDALHGRFRREFDKRLPSMYTILKAKSLAKSQKSEPIKKTRLGSENGMNLEIHMAQRESEGQASLSKWFQCFDIVVNTWAVTGCFDIIYESKTRKYVHWNEVTAYMYEFQARAIDLKEKQFPEYRAYVYLSTVEEDLRGKAIELCRGEDDVPFGEALTLARKNFAHIWQERRDVLEARHSTSHQATRGFPAKHINSQGNTPKFKPFCNRYNLNAAGCHQPNCEYPHACSAKLVTGDICGSRNHTAKTHDDGKHGASKGSSGSSPGKGKGKGAGKGKVRK